MSEPLHYFRTGRPDPVSGAFETRCGIKGFRDTRPLPRVEHEGRAIADRGIRYLIADHEINVTCRQCRLQVTPNERKTLRTMLDHGATTRECLFLERNKFSAQIGNAIYIYGPAKLRVSLVGKRLIKGDVYKQHVLTNEGRLLAETFPHVPDEFDKRRKR